MLKRLILLFIISSTLFSCAVSKGYDYKNHSKKSKQFAKKGCFVSSFETKEKLYLTRQVR